MLRYNLHAAVPPIAYLLQVDLSSGPEGGGHPQCPTHPEDPLDPRHVRPELRQERGKGVAVKDIVGRENPAARSPLRFHPVGAAWGEQRLRERSCLPTASLPTASLPSMVMIVAVAVVMIGSSGNPLVIVKVWEQRHPQRVPREVQEVESDLPVRDSRHRDFGGEEASRPRLKLLQGGGQGGIALIGYNGVADLHLVAEDLVAPELLAAMPLRRVHEAHDGAHVQGWAQVLAAQHVEEAVVPVGGQPGHPRCMRETRPGRAPGKSIFVYREATLL
mmetsp:Transcript_34981/g.110530  ORF Transcript_34981/g.110530 Transcript_34981/m.110530 type:complete len:275 (-) Transcript_34981:62-886(-)